MRPSLTLRKFMRCKGGQLEIEGIMVAEGRENSLDDEAMNSISQQGQILSLCYVGERLFDRMTIAIVGN